MICVLPGTPWSPADMGCCLKLDRLLNRVSIVNHGSSDGYGDESDDEQEEIHDVHAASEGLRRKICHAVCASLTMANTRAQSDRVQASTDNVSNEASITRRETNISSRSHRLPVISPVAQVALRLSMSWRGRRPSCCEAEGGGGGNSLRPYSQQRPMRTNLS